MSAINILEKAICVMVFVTVYFQASQAITCYQCNSEYDPRCADPLDDFSLGTVNCSLKPPLEHMPELLPALCRKTTQKTFGKTRVVRGCGYVRDQDRDDKECAKRLGTHEVQALYCSCTEDLCNGSIQIGITNSIMALISIAVGLIIRNQIN